MDGQRHSMALPVKLSGRTFGARSSSHVLKAANTGKLCCCRSAKPERAIVPLAHRNLPKALRLQHPLRS